MQKTLLVQIFICRAKHSKLWALFGKYLNLCGTMRVYLVFHDLSQYHAILGDGLNILLPVPPLGNPLKRSSDGQWSPGNAQLSISGPH